MRTNNKIYIVLLFTFLGLNINMSLAQISYGGEPYSFSQKMDLPKIVQPDATELQNIRQEENKNCTAMEFGKLLNLNISLKDDQWQITKTANGSMIYRLAIKSPQALAVGAYFSDLFIPDGAELFIYSPDQKQLKGSYNYLNNTPFGLFATEYVLGDELIIEYMEPANVIGQGHLIVKDILHAYRGISNWSVKSGFGSAGACEVNVNCPEGYGKRKQIDAVVRINIRAGNSAFWCSGSLINNTSEDRTPYILTADHCGNDSDETDLQQWIFYFNYQSDDCDNPSIEPEHQSMTGCSLIAASSNAGIQGSDFYMVLLNQVVPENYRPYFIGWNRDGEGSDNGYTIHHPAGDIKKISHYSDPLISSNYAPGIPGAYWKVNWTETVTNYGVTEGGSSGSPIFDSEGYLIGTLTGGAASCNTPNESDYYGKFSEHWEANGIENNQQLSPWLDPLNTGIEKMSGIYLGIDEEQILSTELFKALPNPATDNITLYFDRNNSNYLVMISDLSGKIISEFNHQGNNPKTILLNQYPKGVYFIYVETNSKTQVSKVLVL